MRKILIAIIAAGMAGGASAAEFGELFGMTASRLQAQLAVNGGTAPRAVKTAAPGSDSPAAAPEKPVDWVAIAGGTFLMGTDDFKNARPVHEVAVKTFEMSRTAVTVEQYAECVTAGRCTEPVPLPGANGWCNWGRASRKTHPVNCVNLAQAEQYATFKGARLPSEAEWEYAARSGGRNQKYPWGNGDATEALAVMNTNITTPLTTLPVCSKPAGNTAQGLCDMSGNVWQWTRDKYRDSYDGAPADGGALEAAELYRVVLRGGSFISSGPLNMRSDYRFPGYPEDHYDFVGIRLVRPAR